MKVKLFPADGMGCGYYRVFLPAERARQEGIDISYETELHAQWKKDGTLVGLDPIDADVCVFQRPLMQDLVNAIPFVQKQGIAVVVEIDDDFSCLNPNNQVFKIVHPKSNTPYSWNHLKTACRLANIVTCSTDRLSEVYAGHGRFAVVHNAIDSADVGRTTPSDNRTVGWSGSLGVHPGDLQITNGGVADALRKTGAKFFCVGNNTGVQEALHLDEKPEETGWQEYANYIRSLDKLDVGIVPLVDSKFNEGKSYLKGIEYAARGIPFVASPTREYKALAYGEGIGMIADYKAKSWSREIVAMLQSDAYRQELSEEGMQAVTERHTIHQTVDKWISAWEQAKKNLG